MGRDRACFVVPVNPSCNAFSVRLRKVLLLTVRLSNKGAPLIPKSSILRIRLHPIGSGNRHQPIGIRADFNT